MTHTGIALIILGILVCGGATLTSMFNMGTHMAEGFSGKVSVTGSGEAFGNMFKNHLKAMGVTVVGVMMVVFGILALVVDHLL